MRIWPTVLEILKEFKTGPDELTLFMFVALGCKDTTTKRLFEVLSAMGISDALQSQEVMNSSTPIGRAVLFDM